MKKSILIILAIVFLGFENCKKEDKILKKLVGTWKIVKYKRAGNFSKTDFRLNKTTIEFFSYKNAYTSTMKGVFKIDYFDFIKTDLIDTFQYQLKNNEIDITLVQNKRINNAFPNVTPTLIRRRFKIEGYKTNNLLLTRVDSTDLYIKATK